MGKTGRSLKARGLFYLWQEIRIVTGEDIAWVTCIETLDQGLGAEAVQVLSVNVFRAQRMGKGARTRWLLECRATSRLIAGL